MRNKGFTLVELIAVIMIVGAISVVLLSRINTGTAAIQSSRDDLIAALFFAQQQAMMRVNNDPNAKVEISLTITLDTISVTENGAPIVVSNGHYPLNLPKGVTLSAVNATGSTVSNLSLNYDKLGRTTATTIMLTGSGNSSGVSARVRVEASGYAFAN